MAIRTDIPQEQLDAFKAFLEADFDKWQTAATRGDAYAGLPNDYNSPENLRKRYFIEFEVGGKFIKVIHAGNQRSVHSFIYHGDEPLKLSLGRVANKGDILAAASWKAPAKNFIRGNIAGGYETTAKWTGMK